MDAGDSVVLLHGLAAGRLNMWPVHRALSRAGYRTLNLSYPSRSRSLDRLIDPLADEIERRARGTVHFVTHSMGGLVARALLSRRRPARLGRVVMLGPPNGGSEWVQLLARIGLDELILREARHVLTPDRLDDTSASLGGIDYPVGIIAGDRAIDPILPRLVLPRPNDGKVSVAATQLAGAADHIVLRVPHTAMLISPRVHRQAIAFLRDGRFNR
jgi:pimeloyl-ACP methyl ester carboxylesterase